MINVLQTQLYRLKKSKLFLAMIIVCAALPLLGMLFTRWMVGFLSNSTNGNGQFIFQTLQGSDSLTLSAIGGLTDIGSTPALFSIICSSIFLSGEFSGGAIRNMVLANKSRTQIFLSFFTVAMIVGATCFVASFATTVLFYGIAFGFDGVTAAQIVNGCFTSLFLGLLSIALAQSCVIFFLFATRKTGATVAFPLLIIVLLPALITTVVGIVFTVKSLVGQGSAMTLTWIPLYNLTLFDAANIDGGLIGKIVLYNAPIAALFATLGWVSIYKADLK